MSREDFIVGQYRECGRAAALYDNAIWQIPSAAFLISGALITLAYGYTNISFIRGIVLTIAAVWTFILFIVMNKHMFFVLKQKEKMICIEVEEFKISSLQRFSQPRKELKERLTKFDYAFDGWESPKGIAIGAHRILKIGMVILSVMLLILAISNFFSINF